MVEVEATVGHRSLTQKPEGEPQGVGRVRQMRRLALGPGRESIPSTTQWAKDRHKDQTKLGPSRASPQQAGAEAPGLSQEQWHPTA